MSRSSSQSLINCSQTMRTTWRRSAWRLSTADMYWTARPSPRSLTRRSAHFLKAMIPSSEKSIRSCAKWMKLPAMHNTASTNSQSARPTNTSRQTWRLQPLWHLQDRPRQRCSPVTIWSSPDRSPISMSRIPLKNYWPILPSPHTARTVRTKARI